MTRWRSTAERLDRETFLRRGVREVVVRGEEGQWVVATGADTKR